MLPANIRWSRQAGCTGKLKKVLSRGISQILSPDSVWPTQHELVIVQRKAQHCFMHKDEPEPEGTQMTVLSCLATSLTFAFDLQEILPSWHANLAITAGHQARNDRCLCSAHRACTQEEGCCICPEPACSLCCCLLAAGAPDVAVTFEGIGARSCHWKACTPC